VAKRRKGRPVNGILVLNKPLGISSNKALQEVRHRFFAQKAGHTGSLDPLATGVLPICLGEATKFTQYLLDADKGYRSTFKLGIATESGDVDGDIISETSAAHITRDMVLKAIENFKGDIKQVPSMFSALKVNGQPLYKLARQGIEIERKARDITIYQFDLLDFRPGEVAEADVYVECSKGTYIRSLSEDLGSLLDVGGHVSALHRTMAGPFLEEEAVTLEELDDIRDGGLAQKLDHLLLPMDIPVEHFLDVEVPESVAWYLQQGQPVLTQEAYQLASEGDIVRVFHENGLFLGLAEVLEDGMITPRKLVVYQPEEETT